MPDGRPCRSVARRRVTKFSDSDPHAGGSPEDVAAETETGRIHLARRVATMLVARLQDGWRREYLYTACEHRPDGSYVVERRGADAAGNRKVFDSPAAVRRLYAGLPAEFTADELTRPGLTDSRCHLVVRYFAEHPAFDCELVTRQPLTARKRPDGGGDGV